MLSRLTFALAICSLAFICTPALHAADVQLPTGTKLKQVDFERHIMGLLSKTGCNLGSCHGSFQGKNGFRLSLFGYLPEFDYAALTRDNLGRRVNTQEPDESLLLLKAAGRMAHEGGMRFGKENWVYNIFREWIAQGATFTPGSGAIKDMQVSPPDFAVVQNGKTLQLKVTASFEDGTQEDITPFCDFKITDDAIATVSALGKLDAQQPGDAGLTVLYRGTVRSVRVLVPAPSPKGFKYPDLKATNFIDKEVFVKLKLLNMAPSEMANDYQFLRRITIDTIGILPTPDEIRTFVADTSANKREKKITELLKHPLHAAVWATKLSDITGNNTLALEQPAQLQNRRSQMWHDWLRKRMHENMPYDQLVHGIMTASSTDGKKPEEWVESNNKLDEQLAKGFESDYANKKTLDLFWRRQQAVPIEIWGEKVAAAFLGVRLECAQCHKHPTDRLTQDDYWSFANLFSPVVFVNNQFSTPEMKKTVDAENAKRKEAATGKNNNQIQVVREMFFNPVGTTARLRPIPMTTRTVPPKLLGGDEFKHAAGKDTREDIWKWMRDEQNPFFARSFVNRVWAHYFGIGIVNPVDDFSQANSPSNARLLEALAKEFIASKYDIRKLEQSILMSRTYQLSSKTNDTNQFDKVNFARSYVRPLMAEQVVDVLNSGIGVEENFTAADAPAGRKMSEVGASRLNNGNLAYILRIFGRPPRTTACDCERAAEPALPQTLFRLTDPTLSVKLRSATSRATILGKQKNGDDSAAIEELFLGTVSRLPTEDEKKNALDYINTSKTRLEGLQEIVWALINTREFILNH